MAKKNRPPWIDQLGKFPDYRVASENHVKIGMVRRLRQRLGIPGFGVDVSYRWPKKLLALMGKVPDLDLSTRFGIRRETIFNKRVSLGIKMRPRKSIWTKDVIRRMGKVPDRQIAHSLGVCATTVSMQRRKLGIGSYLSRLLRENRA